ncbi:MULTISPECIES: hypothetical protein [Streptomyces]|uniref:Uncharacterized protein n=2 Tax=Streptomyces TaxID=1883 RepID=A0ABU4KJA3_9ACTN|nr:hypothetical protein [Streptomyces roseolus]MDX2297809.1 hypothetical protein [Streptomyces roseolus]
MTGLFGLLCLVTLLAPRPLMSLRAQVRHRRHPGGRGVRAEALARIALAHAAPTDTMVVVSPVMLYGALGAWTAWFGRRRAAEGARRQAEAEAAAAATA